MTLIRAQVLAVVAAFVTALAVSSCGTAARQDQGLSASATSAEQVAAHNADDVLFAQLMIPHHQQAIELAMLVPDRSSNPDVVALASKIVGEQQPEINTMKALLLQWNVNPTEMPHESGHAGMTMAGMVDDATLVKLDSLKGADFDALWLQSMINHHRGAIEMARSEIADGKSADMVTLARNVVSAQQVELDQMTQMSGG